jgi:hypothetical protein
MSDGNSETYWYTYGFLHRCEPETIGRLASIVSHKLKAEPPGTKKADLACLLFAIVVTGLNRVVARLPQNVVDGVLLKLEERK